LLTQNEALSHGESAEISKSSHWLLQAHLNAVITAGGETLSYPGNVAVSETLLGDELVGIELQLDAIALGALSADTAPHEDLFPRLR